MNHPNASIERINITRLNGGRGIVNIRELCEKQIEGLIKYFQTKSNSSLHTAIINADNNYTPLHLKILPQNHDQQSNLETELINKWKSKALHGKHIAVIELQHVDKQLSHMWLKKGQLYPETEGFAIAIQDHVVNTLNYRKYILKDGTVTSDACRKCHLALETIEHITAGCRLLAATEYTDRHNNVAKIIYKGLINVHKIQTITTPYYQYHPQSITENASYKVYYDLPIHTDKTINANRPDIVFINKTKKNSISH